MLTKLENGVYCFQASYYLITNAQPIKVSILEIYSRCKKPKFKKK